jgi:cobalt-zinc-cadmium efflux system outer membrane protein
MSIVIETIDTFKKILRNYNTRAALTPEQKVSKNVFEFAIKDYENQKISLATEQTEIESFFNALNLVSFTKVTSFVQSLTFNVEAVENRFTSVLKDKNERGPELQLATAQLKLASADYSLEKSQVWGDLSIGPIYQYRYEEGSGFPVIGIGLTLPLPLYNQNSGGTQRAAYELKSAEYLQQYATKKIQSEWIMLDNAFKQIAANIKQQPSKSEIEKKHHELEGLFYRGLVPSSLIVEAHRQLLDLTQSQHEQQLKCLQLLYRSFALNGELPKEYL